MVEGTCVRKHFLNKEQLFYDLKRRGFEPNIVDLIRFMVSTLPHPWPVQDIHAKLKTNFVDMRELGEMLKEIELDLVTVKTLSFSSPSPLPCASNTSLSLSLSLAFWYLSLLTSAASYFTTVTVPSFLLNYLFQSTMPTMYCNFTKGHAFPLVSRVSRQTGYSKPSKNFCFQPSLNGVDQNNQGNNFRINARKLSYGFDQRASGNAYEAEPRNFSIGFCQSISQNSYVMKSRNSSNRYRLKALENIVNATSRSFSNGSNQKPMENDIGARRRKVLPWLAANKNRESYKSEKITSEKSGSSSWEDSADSYFSRNSSKPSDGDKKSRFRTVDDVETGRSGYAKIYKKEEALTTESNQSSWEDSASGYFSKNGTRRLTEKRENRIGTSDDREYDRISTKVEDEREKEDDVDEPVDDPRKTWKEAHPSTVPEMVGEGVYGVGPVLAALTIARREFYALHVQEGLDLTSSNRKKKDKKGVEKVLRIAERIGLTVKETSKHDLNMVVDNRPHQGLVLDASPLEMVSIRGLDPVSDDTDKAPVWVALDEVTDPQNLGAIVRSAYFFGASGVVLCAKNSAPLSGVVSKASAGSLELIELRSCKNMMQFLSNSVENGWWVLGGSVSSKALPLNEVAAGTPTILVLGSEGSGLRPLVEKSCTQLIRIPGNIPMDTSMRGVSVEEVGDNGSKFSGEEFQSFMAVESLNVSVAAGVLLYHLVGNTSGQSGAKHTDAIE
ncbi:tRNA/rRNA methyltransferase [Cinnamomum micranthum f. kanehirae]|uniref:rRNA methyltransferase 1, mitochondrial n=1 Tax=Cinnamomum micranthum f. kanehirae TaxID=337451 RepID=A0A443N4T3_9MAGN|nr:tRNA/rRNA methyltransferase [Cinnamomum micranthum f. kanehirae]